MFCEVVGIPLWIFLQTVFERIRFVRSTDKKNICHDFNADFRDILEGLQTLDWYFTNFTLIIERQLPISGHCLATPLRVPIPGLKLYGGNEGDCLSGPGFLPWCPPWPPVNALVPLKSFSRNLQFPHYRVPFTKEKMPWCPCPFKNEAYRSAIHPSFSRGALCQDGTSMSFLTCYKHKVNASHGSTGNWTTWDDSVRIFFPVQVSLWWSVQWVLKERGGVC